MTELQDEKSYKRRDIRMYKQADGSVAVFDVDAARAAWAAAGLEMPEPPSADWKPPLMPARKQAAGNRVFGWLD